MYFGDIEIFAMTPKKLISIYLQSTASNHQRIDWKSRLESKFDIRERKKKDEIKRMSRKKKSIHNTATEISGERRRMCKFGLTSFSHLPSAWQAARYIALSATKFHDRLVVVVVAVGKSSSWKYIFKSETSGRRSINTTRTWAAVESRVLYTPDSITEILWMG